MEVQETPCRNSFVFFRSFYESIGSLPDDVQLILLRAVIKYGLDQAIPDFSGVPQQPFVEAIFAGIRPQLDANYKRFLNGCKGAGFGNRGGAPKGNTNARKQPQNNPKTTPNVNEDVNVNEDEDIKKEKQPVEESELILPFQDHDFVITWNELRQQPKWKSKTKRALQMSLNQLSKYDVHFAVYLMENAIAGNYKGVVFYDTPTKYNHWKNNTTNSEHEEQPHGTVIKDVNDLY